jgi:secretion/DNA translocation related TadE-like protein
VTRRPRDERGGATILVLVMAGLLLLLGAGLGVVAALVVAHRAAQSGADLAALAGARAAAHGEDGCVGAAEVAAANDVRVMSCRSDGRVVEVWVSAPGPRWLGQRSDLSAHARAGPAAGQPP